MQRDEEAGAHRPERFAEGLRSDDLSSSTAANTHYRSRILEALPDDATLEEIQYRLYVRQAIDAGLRDIAEGRTLTQEEVEQRVARRIGK